MDSDKVMTDTGTDTGSEGTTPRRVQLHPLENLGHGQISDTRVRSSLVQLEVLVCFSD